MYTSSLSRQILDRHDEAQEIPASLNCISSYVESIGMGTYYRDGTEAKNHIAHFLYENGSHKTCEVKGKRMVWSKVQ